MAAPSWNSRRRRGDLTRGFTLVELCAVLVIAGILMAIAGPKLLETSAFDQRGYTDELAAAIRSSEAAAAASGCNVQLTITPGIGYVAALQPGAATCFGAFATPVLRADDTPLTGGPPSDADVSAPIALVLAPQGRVVSPAPNGNTIPIAVGGRPPGTTLTLQIDPLSGFVIVP